jgi:hypothetical protein
MAVVSLAGTLDILLIIVIAYYDCLVNKLLASGTSSQRAERA